MGAGMGAVVAAVCMQVYRRGYDVSMGMGMDSGAVTGICMHRRRGGRRCGYGKV